MRFRNSGGVRGVVALSLSLMIAGVPIFSRHVHSAGETATTQAREQNKGMQRQTKISLLVATGSKQGVLVRWRTAFEISNVGFNVYRELPGQRKKVNREIVPGSVFIVGENVPLAAGYSYSLFDPEGTEGSLYWVEALGIDGTITNSGKIAPEWNKKELAQEGIDASPSALTSSFLKEYPTGTQEPLIAEGQIEDQWAIASQPGLKISITKDGWYRVTQQQMTGAGFNPVVDIANLRLFNRGRELAILTNRTGGPFTSGDFIEFYGEAIDTPTTGTNTYYLLAGSTAGRRIPTPGKRVRGAVRSESTPATSEPATSTLLPTIEFNPRAWFWWLPPVIAESVETTTRIPTRQEFKQQPNVAVESFPVTALPENRPSPNKAEGVSEPSRPSNATKREVENTPSVIKESRTPVSVPKSNSKRSKKGKKKKGMVQRKYAHPVLTPPGDANSFDNTVELKDRSIFFSSLINGETENFFGPAIVSSVEQRLITPNPRTDTGGLAHIEIALQGVGFLNHLITVELNGTVIGTISFTGLQNKIQTFDVPVTQLRTGDCANLQNPDCNVVRLIRSSSQDVSLVDYLRITYPHSFRADNGALRFSLGPSESATIDGFNTPGIRVIDYTDPLSVRIGHSSGEAAGSGYSIRVLSETGPSRTRKLLAISETSADHPAALSLNEPSTLNLSSNGADLVIITHRSLMQSMEPLRALRTSQQLATSVFDVEDVYDEFSYGVHGPQAIRDFLNWAVGHWVKAPRYVILAGDGSYDPRNYMGFGNRDFVPTKLVDATFNETSSDDWLTDFDNDGAADIPVGRLPVSSVAQANLVVSKIVNFSPANVPQSALLVADTQGTYFFNFEQANSQVQALLPPSMAVERVDRRTQPSDAQATANIIAKFNAGQSLVNYSGHGNVDTWTDGSIFTSTIATSLTNGNKLSFVVVMDCLNGYFQEPNPGFSGLAEALLQAPNGGAVASFASSGLTLPDGQHAMSLQLYTLLYGGQSIALGDAIKSSKTATNDIDVRRTWIFFGDPSMKIR